MTKLRHNKKRNTAFLYETLIRELTKAILSEDSGKKETITSLLKRHFGKNTALFKELELYKSLLDSKNLDLYVAEKLIFESKREYSSFNKKKIFNEQSVLISKINKDLSNKIFANFVPNYKNIATISQLFNNEDLSVKKKVILEQTIIESITKKEEKQNVNGVLQPMDNIVFNSFIKNFNSEYDQLLEEQRNLLNVFVSSFKGGDSELNAFLNEELGRLKKQIKNALSLSEVKDSSVIKNKMKNTLELMEGFREQPIDKDMLQQVLKIQQLAKELYN